MKSIAYCLLILSAFSSCVDSSKADQDSFPTTTLDKKNDEVNIPSLTFIWETDSLLTTVESVLYDPVSQFIYTANIEGNFMEKDGRGSISKIDTNGNIVDKDWIPDLNAPTGLSIAKGTMFTTDIDELVEIDVATGEIRNVIPVEGAQALNDVTISPEGVVYASDTGGNAIYTLENGLVTPFVNDINTPNGLVYHNNALLVSQWAPEILQSLDVSSKSLTKLAGGLPQADGIEVLGNQGYLVSSWGGRLFFVDHEGNTTKILDTSSEGINAADVSLVVDEKIVLVATFSKNSIAAYKIE